MKHLKQVTCYIENHDLLEAKIAYMGMEIMMFIWIFWMLRIAGLGTTAAPMGRDIQKVF